MLVQLSFRALDVVSAQIDTSQTGEGLQNSREVAGLDAVPWQADTKYEL